MTRKDYVLLAIAINDIRQYIPGVEPDGSHKDLLDGVEYAAESIADALARDNPRFDKERFMCACGVV